MEHETTQEVYNAAQEAWGAAGHETKKIADTADVANETWEESSGHSGTPRAWVACAAIIAAFIAAGVSLTQHLYWLTWTAAGVVVAVAVAALATRTWSDYRPRSRRTTHG